MQGTVASRSMDRIGGIVLLSSMFRRMCEQREMLVRLEKERDEAQKDLSFIAMLPPLST